MIEYRIPGWGHLCCRHLVLDYNGTLAVNGVLLDGVAERFAALATDIAIHVVTADTFGRARTALEGLPCTLAILPEPDQAQAKLAFIRELGAEHVVAIGNGRNDRLMLRHAALGMAVVQGEGAATETLLTADLVAPDIRAALDLLRHPKRLTATLRS